MPMYLGIDTSNYTTSLALYDSDTSEIHQVKKPLPVRQGQIGLRQSDAVFSHVNQLGAAAGELFSGQAAAGIGVSEKPRSVEGSYMPCFRVGLMAAETLAAAMGVPLHRFSHQDGHLAAALYGAGRLDLMEQEFLAFHVSGGTTECLHVMPDEDTVFAVDMVSQSQDLFAGQLIDRVGAMLDLPFPSGAHLETLAAGAESKGAKPVFRDGNPCISGLENQCRKRLDTGASHAEVAAFAIQSIGNLIEQMTAHALKQYPGLPVVYAGGVMSNQMIRRRMEAVLPGNAFFAPPPYSSDNAAGIAVLAGRRCGACK